MSFNIQKLPDEPILLCEFQADFNESDVSQIWSESVRLTPDLPGPIYRINDTRKVKVDFGTLVVVLAQAARNKVQPGAVGDPRFIDMAVIEPGGIGALAADSMAQDQYGGFNIPMFESVEEALQYARQES